MMKSLGLSVGIKMIPKRVFLWDQVSFSLLIIMTGFRKGYLLSHFKQKILEYERNVEEVSDVHHDRTHN